MHFPHRCCIPLMRVVERFLRLIPLQGQQYMRFPLQALLAIWSFGSANGAAGVDPRISANVEYTVVDALGNVKAHEFFHNATSDHILDDANDAISDSSFTVGSATVFTGIAICSDEPNDGAANGFAPATCTLITAVTENNPVTAGAVNLGEQTYNVVQTFTATGAITIEELQLVKNPVDTTVPVVGNIGAVRDVAVTLANTDTIQITWTVTIT